MDINASAAPLPSELTDAVARRLQPGERLVCWFAPDLDAGLQYKEGLVVLTDRRLLTSVVSEGMPPGGHVGGSDWPSWDLGPDLSLQLRDRAGLESLELFQTAGRLARWRFTLARGAAARRLIDRFEARVRGEDVEAIAPPTINCPSCGLPIPAQSTTCPTCHPAKGAKPAASLWRLLLFARPWVTSIVAGVLLTVASTGTGLIPPYLTGRLTDLLYPSDLLNARERYRLVIWYLVGLTAAAVVTWLLSWARTYVVAWFSERVAADLRNKTYSHLQKLSLEYFGGKRTGDLMSRLSSDTDRLCNFLSINLLDFLNDVLMIAMTAALLVVMDPMLAAVTLLPFPVIYWLVHVVRDRIRHDLHRGNRAWADMTSVLADTIPGIRVVKAFAQERREEQRFRQSNDRVLDSNDRVNRIWTFFGPVVNLLTQLGLLVIWAFGAWQVYGGRMKPGVLVSFQLLIGRFYIRLESMSRMVQATQRAAASSQRLFEILDRTPTVAEPTRPVTLEKVRGEIELRNVGFRHGSRMILDGINLTIHPGEMIGLVGTTGAGKSTLVNLVCRFYDVAEGSILVDGVDVRSFAVSEYRRHIGLVLQEPFLFFGTIAENISYGRPEATREEVIAAARAARCHEFILRLPDGYDSLVGERGQSLSGGERQRLSIARALLIDPAILILDEATSSVDTETEREIQAALDNLTRGRTTIAIAHRLSTLRKADRIVVMERGKIAEVGQHHELLKSRGAYARLHKAQAELAAR
ncbi:MAG: ABC transporter ATP-binding protein/permease [Planctomycetia bacterium]|nr:ABC transporter ATP-binding protein/permease [Planctomycetia bacterium]